MRPDASSLLRALTVLPKRSWARRFDLGLLQLVLLDDLEDEVFLFAGAVPVTILGLGLTVAVAALTATLTIAVAVCGQVTGFLDAGIDAFLEQFVQPGAFGLHLVEICDFGPEGDGELMGAVAGQTQLFLIIAFECDHVFLSFRCWFVW